MSSRYINYKNEGSFIFLKINASKKIVMEIKSTESIRKRGNSLYILVRKEIAEKLSLEEGDLVEISIKKLEEK